MNVRCLINVVISQRPESYYCSMLDCKAQDAIFVLFQFEDML